jgi:hypothetical protein
LEVSLFIWPAWNKGCGCAQDSPREKIVSTLEMIIVRRIYDIMRPASVIIDSFTRLESFPQRGYGIREIGTIQDAGTSIPSLPCCPIPEEKLFCMLY